MPQLRIRHRDELGAGDHVQDVDPPAFWHRIENEINERESEEDALRQRPARSLVAADRQGREGLQNDGLFHRFHRNHDHYSRVNKVGSLGDGPDSWKVSGQVSSRQGLWRWLICTDIRADNNCNGPRKKLCYIFQRVGLRGPLWGPRYREADGSWAPRSARKIDVSILSSQFSPHVLRVEGRMRILLRFQTRAVGNLLKFAKDIPMILPDIVHHASVSEQPCKVSSG